MKIVDLVQKRKIIKANKFVDKYSKLITIGFVAIVFYISLVISFYGIYNKSAWLSPTFPMLCVTIYLWELYLNT